MCYYWWLALSPLSQLRFAAKISEPAQTIRAHAKGCCKHLAVYEPLVPSGQVQLVGPAAVPSSVGIIIAAVRNDASWG